MALLMVIKGDKVMSEKNEKKCEKEERSTYVWLYLHLLLVFCLSLFILFGLKEASLYYLIGMWVIMIVYAWRTLVYIGIRRFLPCMVFAVVIICCILSLTFKVTQGEEERDISAEEAEYEVSAEEAESESGAQTVAASEDAASEETEEPLYEWQKHHASKHEDESFDRKGFFTVYKYAISGEGEEHTKEEIKAYEINTNWYLPYPKISAKCHIEWPNGDCGLTAPALAKVRRAILWMAFCETDFFTPACYERIKGLGESRESILNYRDEVKTEWYKDLWDVDIKCIGEISENDKCLSNSDFARLHNAVLCHSAGKKPAREGDEVSDECLEAAIGYLKEYAQACLKCKPKGYHICSQFTFDADVRLSWPFGLNGKEGAKWYERPVLCVNYFGWSNDGGSGNHSMMNSKVYSLPDGEELFLTDYIAEEKKEAFQTFLKERLKKDFKDNYYYQDLANKTNLFEYINEVYMNVNEAGITLRWWTNEEVAIKWQDLEPFRKGTAVLEDAAKEGQDKQSALDESGEVRGLNKGTHALYEYVFRRKGPAHTQEEIEKYGITLANYNSTYAPDVRVLWHIEWPLETCGLTAPALAVVRRYIMLSCFEHRQLLIVPEELLEKTETRLSKDGKTYENAQGKPPLEGDVIPTEYLEEALQFYKDLAHESYPCKLTKGHECSQLTFNADVRLSWPFGLGGKEGAKWYEKPVLCVNYEQSIADNDAGDLCHHYNSEAIYSLPSGEVLNYKDYFAEDKMDDLGSLVKDRLIKEQIDREYYREFHPDYEEDKKYLKEMKGVCEVVSVNEKGMTLEWTYDQDIYHMHVADFSPVVFIEWQDLEQFKK